MEWRFRLPTRIKLQTEASKEARFLSLCLETANPHCPGVYFKSPHFPYRGVNLHCISWGQRRLAVPQTARSAVVRSAPFFMLWVKFLLEKSSKRSFEVRNGLLFGWQESLIVTVRTFTKSSIGQALIRNYCCVYPIYSSVISFRLIPRSWISDKSGRRVMTLAYDGLFL